MITYKWVKIYGYNVAVDDQDGTVHHAVSDDGQRTLFPYEQSIYDGLDLCSGWYTVNQFRRRMKKGQVCFK